MISLKGLILAGGNGTRMRPLTHTVNKHMLPVANLPVLFYGLKKMEAAGIKSVGVILGPFQEGIRDSVGNGSQFGIEVTYISQGPPRGLADAVRCARSFLGDDDFVMYLGDNLLEGGLEPFVSRFHRTRADAVVAVTRVVNPTLYGVIELDGDQILSIEEKPLTPRSNLAIVGIYVFSPKIHEVIFSLKPSGRGELEITDALRVLHQSHRRVVVQPLEGWWKDTGRPADLLTANDLELGGLSAGGVSNLARVSEGATLQGRVTVGPETVIEAGAAVYGPVVLGRGVRVGKGTHIGPGTAIGDHAQLEGCTIGRSIVMEVARIVGPVKIRDSLIGRRVQILAEKPGESEMEFLLGDDSVVRIRPSDQ